MTIPEPRWSLSDLLADSYRFFSTRRDEPARMGGFLSHFWSHNRMPRASKLFCDFAKYTIKNSALKGNIHSIADLKEEICAQKDECRKAGRKANWTLQDLKDVEKEASMFDEKMLLSEITDVPEAEQT